MLKKYDRHKNTRKDTCEDMWKILPKVCKLCIVVSRRKQSEFAQTASA